MGPDDRYLRVCALAGKWRLAAWDRTWAIDADVIPVVGCALYVVLDGAFEILYVGKVQRPGRDGVRKRINEHIRDPRRWSRWKWLWIIPLDETISGGDLAALKD